MKWLVMLAAVMVSGCASLYSSGTRPDGTRWRTIYSACIWDKDFKGVDLARGKAESLESKPDAETAGAVATGVVEGLK
jgi:hypothetical protein